MNFKNENNNNEKMNNEVELNNNKGDIKMNNKNQFTIDDIKNIEKNPEVLLKIQPKRLNKRSKKYLNKLTLEQMEQKKELVINLINAYHINNTMNELKLLKKYNIKFIELISIAPKLYEACKENPRNIEYDIKAGKFKHEIKELNNRKIRLRWNLLFLMHGHHKTKEAIKEMDIDEINQYIGIIKHFIHTKGTDKATKLINKLYEIICPGLEEEKKKRPALDKQDIIE